MPPTPVLETPRLVLRPVRSKDAPVIQRRFPHWEVVRWLDAKIPWPYPADGAATYVAACLEEMARGEKSHWAIIPKSGPADLIGMHRPLARRRRQPQPARLLARSGVPGQGPDDRGRRTRDGYAFCDLGWPHLWLTNAQDNHPSRRIKERQGARLVDLMIGEHVGGKGPQMVWLLTQEDWTARQAA